MTVSPDWESDKTEDIKTDPSLMHNWGLDRASTERAKNHEKLLEESMKKYHTIWKGLARK